MPVLSREGWLELVNGPGSTKEIADKAVCHRYLRSQKSGKRWVDPQAAFAMGHRKRAPTAAIREKCLDCCGGQAIEVTLCPATECPLWPYRMGRSPFFGKEVNDAR